MYGFFSAISNGDKVTKLTFLVQIKAAVEFFLGLDELLLVKPETLAPYIVILWLLVKLLIVRAQKFLG